jgi:integrase
MKFTDRYLMSLKPTEKEFCIREGHGFTIRVLPSGTKTFQYIFTLKGKRKRLSLGNYPSTSLAEAREKYRGAASMVSKGLDPLAPPEQAPAAYTINKLVDDYMESCSSLAPRSIYDIRRTINHDVLPEWDNRIISEIRRKDAIKLIEKVAGRAPGQGRNVLKTCRAMFAYALQRERVDFNPFSGVSAAVKVIAPSSRERTLADKEIIHVWRSLMAEEIGTNETRKALQLILLTAQRPGEVAGMAKCEIEGDWWTIPAERAKNGVAHRVYLTPFSRKLLPNLVCEWYFPSPKLDSPIGRYALSHILSKNPKDKKGDPTRLQYLGLPRWTPHDLRRTAATKLSELGCSDEIIDAILNHVKMGIIGTYNRYKYDKEKKKWLTKWAIHIQKLLEY